jgi:methylisocitrate lyase
VLFSQVSVADKRAQFRSALASGKLLRFPGAFSPYVSLLIEKQGFDGVYLSGATIANDLALPDIGLTTLSEVSHRARAIARVTKLPALLDIDTGFGEVLNVARTIQEMEESGVCGVHLEDQVNPKRCGHLDNKALVDTQAMVKKLQAAVKGRRDPKFLIMARTDSRASEGLNAALERAKAYVGAGAEAIFPEALADEKEFEQFRKEIKVPLLANMTEFGKSKLLNAKTLENLGYNLVIYPVTLFRLSSKAVEEGLKEIQSRGTQEGLLGKMQTRRELYEYLQYERYNEWDQQIFNFKL